ncbi:hypothetical protein ACGFXC_30220 [Streptomyces sp. NPDC048507]|uniref:hypothetical protein n=1 Tax=Streptomyces sp. NPDC048507 TaxID=3365560 RepID=UPI00371AD9B1
MAEQLIDALSMTWDPAGFHDTFQERVAALIDAERTGETVEKAEPAAEPTGAVDLMEALRGGVERVGGRPPRNAAARRQSRPARAGACATGLPTAAKARG